MSFENLDVDADTTVAELKEAMVAAIKEQGKGNDKIDWDQDITIENSPAVNRAMDNANGFSITVALKDTPETPDDGKNKPLTLQIGDTGDDFNKMKLSIGDMHTAAMGKKFVATQ